MKDEIGYTKMNTSTVARIEFHPAANIFPMMTGSEFEALKTNIEQNGLIQPIYLFNNQIIDGRNRYLACLEMGVQPVFRDYEGDEKDLLAFVISLNLQRRHLNTSQKACLAVELLPELERITKANLSSKMSAIRKGQDLSNLTKPENSRNIAAQSFGVSGGYISLAKQIRESNLELFEQIKNGSLSLQKAKLQLNQKSEVLSNLTKPEPIELTKNELRRIAELIAEFGISEDKARAYILKKRVKRAPENEKNKRTEMKEVKVRFTEEIKNKLHDLAKEQHKSVAEILRELVRKSYG